MHLRPSQKSALSVREKKKKQRERDEGKKKKKKGFTVEGYSRIEHVHFMKRMRAV